MQKLGGEAEPVQGPAGVLPSLWELGTVGQQSGLEQLRDKLVSVLQVMGAVEAGVLTQVSLDSLWLQSPVQCGCD